MNGVKRMKISFYSSWSLRLYYRTNDVTSFHEWIKGYDLHTITEKQPIPLETRKRLRN